jgi:KipI family sensor histidine kinase inhibitor
MVPAVRSAIADRPGVVEAVAGARTVLVVFDRAVTSAQRVSSALDSASVGVAEPGPELQFVEVRVVYDGPDLAEVAAEVGLSDGQVAELHVSGEYTVRFCGFSPGFAYLDGLDPRLYLPRRSSPRTAVPAGSVAVAGEFTGVYPRSSPGGWRLLGRTDAELWDVTRDPPALLVPGARVRFVRA